jgi:hypothetical protein
MDCSFISKSGKHSYGLGHFYNGSIGRAEKGLEVSLISIVDVEASIGYGIIYLKPTAMERSSSLRNPPPSQ